MERNGTDFTERFFFSEPNGTDFTERNFCLERNGTDFTERIFFWNGTERFFVFGTERNGFYGAFFLGNGTVHP